MQWTCRVWNINMRARHMVSSASVSSRPDGQPASHHHILHITFHSYCSRFGSVSICTQNRHCSACLYTVVVGFFFFFVFLLSVALALYVPAIDAPKHTAPSSWWGEKCCLFSIRFEFKSGEWWSSHCSTDADESRIHLCSFDFLLLDEHIIAYSIANAMYTILANWIFCVFMHGKSDIF